jgi:NADPH-dependent glutamate synthase beta subunit-like oxidoreductase
MKLEDHMSQLFLILQIIYKLIAQSVSSAVIVQKDASWITFGCGSPCRSSCPIGQNCQAYIQQIQRGQSERALSTVLETNPLPRTLGYLCHQPCQQSCARLNVDGEPVAIRALKRHLVENLAFPAPAPLPELRPEVIGIIGSGPAGLMAAWELRRCGYKVIVYDTDTTPGGNLTRVIPEFRLPQKVALADMEWIERWGVEFRLGFRVGRDMGFETFHKQHRAVLLATGGGQPMRLHIDGEDSVNVCAALPFLEAVRQGKNLIWEALLSLLEAAT